LLWQVASLWETKIPWIHDSRCARLWHCELLSTHDVQEHGGFETLGDSGTLTNFVEISQSRDKILRVPQTRSSTDTCHCRSSCSGLTVLQVSGTVSTSGSATSIGPKGYLTSLDSQVIKTEAEIGDIRSARMLFDSLIKFNPKHASGWIAAAVLEEHAGRMVAARKLIKQGCDQCPKSEDVSLEAARLLVRGLDILSS
jgi:pre-mRNA-processing factor 6